MIGWIKIHRKIIDWEWYDDPNTFRLFMHLLFTVNHEPKKWRGVNIPAGSRIAGRIGLSRELGISEQSIRTSIKNLELTSELTRQKTPQGTVFQIVNWLNYQEVTSQLTSNQPEPNQSLTRHQPQLKNNKNVKNNIYVSQNEFLEDWGKVREHFDKKPTNIKKLTSYELVKFNLIKTNYSKEEIRNAIQGLFQQKNMFPSTRLRPTHFLDEGNIDKYLDCYNNKTQLF